MLPLPILTCVPRSFVLRRRAMRSVWTRKRRGVPVRSCLRRRGELLRRNAKRQAGSLPCMELALLACAVPRA
jgi:hypothetical protein